MFESSVGATPRRRRAAGGVPAWDDAGIEHATHRGGWRGCPRLVHGAGPPSIQEARWSRGGQPHADVALCNARSSQTLRRRLWMKWAMFSSVSDPKPARSCCGRPTTTPGCVEWAPRTGGHTQLQVLVRSSADPNDACPPSEGSLAPSTRRQNSTMSSRNDVASPGRLPMRAPRRP